MRLRLPSLLAALILALPLAAHAMDEGNPSSALFAAIKARQPKQVEQILFATSFDPWVLGRALLDAVEVNGAKSERDAFRMALILLSKGAEVDYADTQGRTPLMRACEKRYGAVASMLLEQGASVDMKDQSGRKAIDYLDTGTGDASTLLWLLDKAERDRKELARLYKVNNLRASLREGVLVVTYDLVGKDPVPVKLKVTGQNGRTYTLDTALLTGDVGKPVPPGRDRQIVWAMSRNYPNGLEEEEFTLDVVVSQR